MLLVEWSRFLLYQVSILWVPETLSRLVRRLFGIR